MRFVFYFGLIYLIQTVIYVLVKKMDINDLPNARKVHKDPIPRIGGYAIFISFIFVMIMLADLMPSNYIYIFYGMGVLLFVGLFDDIFDMPALYKLIGQALSAFLVVQFGGIYPLQLGLPFGLVLQFPDVIGKIISVIWIVAIINAVNLLDGLDGLAAGFGLITISTITVMSFLQNNTVLPTMGLIFMICLIVFLIIILFIPFLDALSAIIRRKRNGRGIHLADKRHIHHMILKSSKTHRGAVLKMYVLFASVAIGTIIYYYNKPIGIFIVISSILNAVLTFWRLGVISETQGEKNE
jgi:UDP-GlcNAc:undecaprenyl-phosphate GlcNAc-1-phosphate transferase